MICGATFGAAHFLQATILFFLCRPIKDALSTRYFRGQTQLTNYRGALQIAPPIGRDEVYLNGVKRADPPFARETKRRSSALYFLSTRYWNSLHFDTLLFVIKGNVRSQSVRMSERDSLALISSHSKLKGKKK